MTNIGVQFKDTRDLPLARVLELYRANGWSSVEKPRELHQALRGSHSVVSAWDGDKLVGLGNAISDGCLVVYYPHLLVLPEYRGKGVGREIMEILKAKYGGFHQHCLIADGKAVGFYKKCGFERAGKTQPMWIYQGHDH